MKIPSDPARIDSRATKARPDERAWADTAGRSSSYGQSRAPASKQPRSILSPEKIPCRILDTASIDFSAAVSGRKTAETRVIKAKGGESIETRNSQGQTESVYVAHPGDAIFANSASDRYVPAGPDGKRWQFDRVADHGYRLRHVSSNETMASSTKTFPVLKDFITEPSCIVDAWEKGCHQFLYPGASLKKQDDGKVTGIDKEAFDKTWEITAK